jgi:3-hydroxyisobutyrate dehydrogenase
MLEGPSIAFLGLGTMGSAMARRLLRAGLRTTVYNRGSGPAEGLVAEGAHVARSPREAARRADVLITMVTDDEASRAVWEGDDGALSGAPSGALVIESSTVSSRRARSLGEVAASKGLAFLDAPVMGSREQAAAGELVFLAGGDSSHVARARSLLAHLGRIHHVGPVGSGAALKLVANAVLAAQIASLAEAFAFLEKSDLALEPAVLALASGSVASPVVRTVSARMLAGDRTPRFALSLLVKDLGYALAEARAQGVEQPITELVYRLFASAEERGLGHDDVSAVVEAMRERKR